MPTNIVGIVVFTFFIPIIMCRVIKFWENDKNNVFLSI